MWLLWELVLECDWTGASLSCACGDKETATPAPSYPDCSLLTGLANKKILPGGLLKDVREVTEATGGEAKGGAGEGLHEPCRVCCTSSAGWGTPPTRAHRQCSDPTGLSEDEPRGDLDRQALFGTRSEFPVVVQSHVTSGGVQLGSLAS